MKIIAVTGMPCSGKGEFLEYLKKKGIDSVVMSDAVRKDMEGKGIEVNNKNFREYATGLRKEKGMDVVARMSLPSLKELYKRSTSKAISIDGLRSYEEVGLFKKELTNDFVLVSVFASPKTRYERALKRGKPSDMKTWEEFEWRDNVELGWGLGKVMALSDYIMDNSGSFDEMNKKIDLLLSKIIG